MAAVTRVRALDFVGELPEAARRAITSLLEVEPAGARKVYAALARKVWSLLVERRLDDELRDWHELIQGVKARVRTDDAAVAERLTALADLLRESISLAQTSPAREVANRPRARRILDRLARIKGFVARRVLLEELEMSNSHLSNVLTQLTAHNLLERRGVGKEAEFRITALGRQLIGGDSRREIASRAADMIDTWYAPATGWLTAPPTATDAAVFDLAYQVRTAADCAWMVEPKAGWRCLAGAEDPHLDFFQGGDLWPYGVGNLDGAHFKGGAKAGHSSPYISMKHHGGGVSGSLRRLTDLRSD